MKRDNPDDARGHTAPWIAATLVATLVLFAGGFLHAGATPADLDGDGLSNTREGGASTGAPDTDGDGLVDSRDLDSDGDGLWDLTEATSAVSTLDADDDGIVDSDLDSDGDGIIDLFDPDQGGQPLSPPDRDFDGVPDPYDPDDDGDGIDTAVERIDETLHGSPDGDGVPAYHDTDSDNDGVDDGDETADIDVDSVPDYLDVDQAFVDSPTPYQHVRQSFVLAGQTDPSATVELDLYGPSGFVGSTSIGTNASGHFARSLGAPAVSGRHTLVVTATEPSGASFSQTIPFDVDRLYISVRRPASDAFVDNTTPIVEGRTEPGARVELSFDGGTSQANTIADSEGRFMLFAPRLDEGPLTMSATASNGINTVTVTSSFLLDLDLPGLRVVHPDDGAIIATDLPTFRGVSEPGYFVQVTLDGALLDGSSAAPDGTWEWTPSEPLGDGWHVIEFETLDTAGNWIEATASFLVDTTPPTPAVLVPTEGSVFDLSRVSIRGRAAPEDDVVLFINGTGRPVTVGREGFWTEQVSVEAGVQEVFVVATDRAGNEQRSAVRTFETGPSGAPIQIVEPGLSESVDLERVRLSGVAGVDQRVRVALGQDILGSAATDADGTWTFSASAILNEGPATLSAWVMDRPDAETAVAFEVDRTPPVLVIYPLQYERPPESNPELTGFAEAGATISVVTPAGLTATTTAKADGTWRMRSPPIVDQTGRIWVSARDDAGNSSFEAVPIEWDTKPPLSVFDHPDTDATKAGGSIEAEGFTEPEASVKLELDGTEIGSTTAGPDGRWTLPVGYPRPGGHRLTAHVIDEWGNTSTSRVDFIVDPRASAVVVTSPGERSVIRDDRPRFEGEANPDGTVKLFVDGELDGTTTADSAGRWTHRSTRELDFGSHVVRAESAGEDGIVGNDEHRFVVDPRATFVTILAPNDGATTADVTPRVRGESRAGTAVRVEIDGGLAGEVTADLDGSWEFEFPAPLAERRHELVAIVDGADDRIEFVVDKTAPHVVIESPANGALVADATPEVTGSAEPGTRVVVSINGVEVGSTNASSAGRWRLDGGFEPLPDAEHVAVARVVDRAGNSGSSGEVVFSVDTIPPPLEVTSPQSEAVFEPSDAVGVGGTSDPGASIHIFVDDRVVRTMQTDADGRWKASPLRLVSGEHVISVTASDAAGNTTTAPPIPIRVRGGGEADDEPTTEPDEPRAWLAGGGGCSQAAPREFPLLPLLFFAAIVGLSWRRRRESG